MLLICKFKGKNKSWWEVSQINFELKTVRYVDNYRNNLEPYAFTTTDLKYVKKFKIVHDDITWIKDKKKSIDKLNDKKWK